MTWVIIICHFIALLRPHDPNASGYTNKALPKHSLSLSSNNELHSSATKGPTAGKPVLFLNGLLERSSFTQVPMQEKDNQIVLCPLFILDMHLDL